jgi:hypothetical protein
MGKRSQHKSAKNRPLKVDPMNRLFRPACSECGAPVDWLTGDEATARGVDLAQSMEFFEIAAIPNRDVWVCTRCGEHGIMGAGGFMGEGGIMDGPETGFL